MSIKESIVKTNQTIENATAFIREIVVREGTMVGFTHDEESGGTGEVTILGQIQGKDVVASLEHPIKKIRGAALVVLDSQGVIQALPSPPGLRSEIEIPVYDASRITPELMPKILNALARSRQMRREKLTSSK